MGIHTVGIHTVGVHTLGTKEPRAKKYVTKRGNITTTTTKQQHESRFYESRSFIRMLVACDRRA